ncbi:MAG: hypothetical protein NTZ74_02010 [Chloroflexi bacterium]|nr:hypothetical protein [Chloroflexota bacterium]
MVLESNGICPLRSVVGGGGVRFFVDEDHRRREQEWAWKLREFTFLMQEKFSYNELP